MDRCEATSPVLDMFPMRGRVTAKLCERTPVTWSRATIELLDVVLIIECSTVVLSGS